MAEDLATLQARLAEAKAAQHTLLIGGAVREIQDQNGERIAYTAGNAAALTRYILLLEWEISKLAGTASPLGPMRVIL